MSRRRPPYALINLANAFLAGPWTLSGLVDRGKRACVDAGRWVRRTANRALKTFGEQTPPSFDSLLAFLRNDAGRAHPPFAVGQYFWLPSAMEPRGGAAATWTLPAITTAGQLAAWLDVSCPRLDWLADVRGWTARVQSPKLRHYVWQWQPLLRVRFRVIESPKPRLKKIQRRILREILDRIPAHDAAHGFRPGRSILSYASAHVGQRIVLRFDLRDFFPSVRASRVHALFRTAGYPKEVARLLTGLCTSRVPPDVWAMRPEPRDADDALGERLAVPHLPQGAPTSPALANRCAYRLDVRLAGLARSAGAVYTRYADDLAFSGGDELAQSARRFQIAVAVIAAEEGFDLHFQKSRFMRRAVCQQLTGVVVNQRPNVRRAVYDELKAILTNCVRHGPATQNRLGHKNFCSHLRGRVAHVEMIHPMRGAKLRAIFERIAW